MQSLGLGKQQIGRVFSYDTEDLNLLKQGVLLRIRQGDDDNDLTVKLRPQVTWERKKLPIRRNCRPKDRSVLELSAKVDDPDAAKSTEKRLKDLASENDLMVGCDSKSKTRTVLESLNALQLTLYYGTNVAA